MSDWTLVVSKRNRNKPKSIIAVATVPIGRPTRSNLIVPEIVSTIFEFLTLKESLEIREGCPVYSTVTFRCHEHTSLEQKLHGVAFTDVYVDRDDFHVLTDPAWIEVLTLWTVATIDINGKRYSVETERVKPRHPRLHAMPRLRDLKIYDRHLDAKLFECMPVLESLEMTSGRLKDIPRGLRTLELYHTVLVDPMSWQLPSLTSLSITDYAINTNTIDMINNLTSLQSLKIYCQDPHRSMIHDRSHDDIYEGCHLHLRLPILVDLSLTLCYVEEMDLPALETVELRETVIVSGIESLPLKLKVMFIYKAVELGAYLQDPVKMKITYNALKKRYKKNMKIKYEEGYDSGYYSE